MDPRRKRAREDASCTPLQLRPTNTRGGARPATTKATAAAQTPRTSAHVGGSRTASLHSDGSSSVTASSAVAAPSGTHRGGELHLSSTAASRGHHVGAGQTTMSGRSRLAATTTRARNGAAPNTTAVVSVPKSDTADGDGDGDNAEMQLQRVWRAKRQEVEVSVKQLRDVKRRLCDDKRDTLDAIEKMLLDHESNVAALKTRGDELEEQHRQALHTLQLREDACNTRRQTSLEEMNTLKSQAVTLAQEKESVQEAVVVEQDTVEQLRRDCAAAAKAVESEQTALGDALQQEERMKDAAYGLSGEVREMVLEMEQLRRTRRESEVAGMEVEIIRRKLYSQCEELKGAIRVYCRVKGSLAPPEGEENHQQQQQQQGESASLTATPQRGMGSATSSHHHSRHQQQVISKAQRRGNMPTMSSSSAQQQQGVAPTANNSASNGGDECSDDLFSFPAPQRPRTAAAAAASAGEEEEEDPLEAEMYASRCICVHQSRANATSTGTQNSTESFTYDHVFHGASSQQDVYREVEPLVNSAVDGYHVCVFAYGQTGSGKTYTMEGIMTSEETYGITPRALRTVFDRQEKLAKEGWSYTLTCSLVEIYNDVLRDLLQSPSIYEPGGVASSNANYHTIKHQQQQGDATAVHTTVTNVVTKKISSMEDFRSIFRLATQHRRTARTQLNDRSSRSHCVFTLCIDGVNEAIRQRSHGALCLVDLAGSERVSDSGVQGQQLKEAININRSLLDLGKCIHALRAGTVVPWRNSRLTYLLQHYLGAKGAKTLMVVTVSDKRAHVAESVNSLRFATRVNDTVVGTSVKRVTSF